jgi:hypothetical protein
MDQEALEANVPIVEEAVVQVTEVVEEADNKHEEEEDAPVIAKSRKRVARPSPVIVTPQQPPPIADHKFWSEMLATKRELDREARRNRFANLVKF